MIVSLLKWTLLPLWMFGSLSANEKDTNCNPFLNINDTITLEVGEIRYPLLLTAGNHLLQLRNLRVEEEYQIWISRDPFRLDCQPQINEIPLLNGQHFSNGTSLSFKAEDIKTQLLLSNPNCSGDLPVTLTIGCNSCASPTHPTAMSESMMGISTDADQHSTSELIKEVFIGGDCFQVEEASIVYTGALDAVGYFSGGENSISIEEGIILSSGVISNAEGANGSFNTGSWMSGISNDPDLIVLTDDETIYDAASLEFDFTPTDEMVSFEYVFASEEYCEYVNSGFNDVFGFFISGPGINGPFSGNAENIAVVPGTADYISINTINHEQNNQFYRNNIPAIHHSTMPFNCNNYPTGNGIAIGETEYDGFTAVMTAMANVIPCETYHIKLVIADLNDAYFDSAVFLKANSFSAGGSANITAEVPGFDNNEITESCTDGFFVFQRTNDDLSEDLIINYLVSNLSTATPGVDYETLPTSITIPAGDSVFYLPVNVYDDLLVEGSEQIVLELESPCSCEIPFTEILILDGTPLDAIPSTETVCVAESLMLTPNTSGGLAGYTYLWNTMDTTQSIEVTPQNPTTYTVTITDYCGQTVATTIDVAIVELPEAAISGFVQVCPESPQAELQIDFNGTGPWNINYSIDNSTEYTVTGITDNPYLLPTTQTGTYHLLMVDNNSCSGDVQGAGTVVETNIQSTSVVQPLTCIDAANGSIDLSPTGGLPPYSFEWNTTATDANIIGLDVGTYWVTVTDSMGCSAVEEIQVGYDPSIPEVAAGSDDLLNCTITSLNLQGNASVGTDYKYLWKTDNGLIDSGVNTLSPMVSEPGMYVLEVTNISTGCMRADTVDVAEDIASPAIDIALDGPNILTCLETTTTLNATNSQPFGTLGFQWSTTDGALAVGLEQMPTQNIEVAGTYTLLLTNAVNGCTETNFITIVENQVLPTVDIQAAPILTCNETAIQLDASNSSSANNFLMSWTSLDGNILSGADGLSPMVDEPGTYELTIVNQQTGCENQMNIEVTQNIVPPLANAEAVQELLDCDTDVLLLSGVGSSAGNDFIYQWTSVDGQIDNGDDGLNPLISAPGTYALVVTDTQNGCTANAETIVAEDVEAPIIQIIVQGSTELTCAEASTILNALDSEPVGQLDFKWTTTDGILEPNTANLPDPEISAPGTYELMVTNLSNGCTSIQSTLITLNDDFPSIHIATPDLITCFENSIALDASNSSQGPEFTTEWTTINGHLLADANTLHPLVDESGVYELVITNTDNGCSLSQTVTVEEDRIAPIAEAGAAMNTLDCNTLTLELNGSASSIGNQYSYRWTSTDGHIAEGANGLTPMIDAPGVYQLLVTNTNNGCIATDEILVNVNENLPYDADLIIESPLCFGDAGSVAIHQVLGGEGPYLFSTDGGESYYIDTAYVMLPGNYTLLIQDINGCDYEHELLVPVIPELRIELQSNLELQLGEQHQLIATPNVPESQIDTIIWEPAIYLDCTDCLDPMVYPFETTTYTITVITENGCIASEKITVSVEKIRDVYIPNAFSPNGDNINDVFMIYANDISIAQVSQFQIFSRWGELIFSNPTSFPPNDESFGWSGNFKEEPLNAGVYVYFAEIEFIDGVKKLYKGDVVLVR